jgi:hypothetical protein
MMGPERESWDANVCLSVEFADSPTNREGHVHARPGERGSVVQIDSRIGGTCVHDVVGMGVDLGLFWTGPGRP